MSAFTATGSIFPFKAEDTGKWTWAVGSQIAWEVRGLGQAFTITIEQGFFSDLGTIPWYMRWLFNPSDPQAALAYLLHDKILQDFGPEHQMFAASQLYEAMRALGVPGWSRKLQVAGVIFAIDNW